MDYHFIRASNKKSQAQFAYFKILKRFAPVFLLALALPFLMTIVLTPSNLRFQTEATGESELRIWLEPANVIMSNGEDATLSVFAQYDGDMLVPEINFEVHADGPVSIAESSYKYATPFSGRVELAKINISAFEEGRALVLIPADKVSLTAFTLPVKIITANSNVIVR